MSRSAVAALVVGAVVLPVAVAGCSRGGTGAGAETSPAPTPSATATPTPTPSRSPVAPGLPTAEPTPTTTPSASYTSSPLPISPGPETLTAFDWRAPSPVTIGEWTLRDCPGDAPLVCVERGGDRTGVVEVLDYPLASLPAFSAALTAGGPEAALPAHADAYLEGVRRDRAQGCGAGYRVEPSATEVLTAGGTPAVRYGFRGSLVDGEPSEVTVQYAAVRGDRLVVLDASAYDEGGCLPPEGDVFSSRELGQFLPVLDALVRTAQFPQPAS